MSTLPIDSELHLDGALARQIGEELAGSYCFAEPYPHIVIDDFLPTPLVERVLATFPPEMCGDKHFENGYQGLHKRQVFPQDRARTPRAFRAFQRGADASVFGGPDNRRWPVARPIL